MIMRTEASAANSMIAPPPGPLSAPPKEIGESLAGAFGVDGHFGGDFSGVELRDGVEATPGATGTAVGGTSVTPCAGTNGIARAGDTRCGRAKRCFT